MPVNTDNLCRRLCIVTNLDPAGPGKYNLIRFLRIMIFINCFILTALANIGFYFDTKKNRKMDIASKILAAVSGGYQSVVHYMEKLFAASVFWARNDEKKCYYMANTCSLTRNC